MDINAWRDAGDFIDFDSAKVFVRHEGTGKPILLIHGFPTSSWDWKDQWQPFLDAGYQLIAPDLLGFGYSDKSPTAPYNMARQADMIETVLKHYDIANVYVLAHDYGDTVAQELLARHNEKSLSFSIDKLCFLNGGLFPGFHHPRPIQKLLAGPFGPLLSKFMRKGTFAKGLNSVFGPNTQASDADLEGFWTSFERDGGRRIVSKLLGYMEERRQNEQRWVGALQNTMVPLRLIDGVQDPVSGGHMADHYEDVVPNPDVIRLDVGHYPQIEAADDVTRHSLAFFDAPK